MFCTSSFLLCLTGREESALGRCFCWEQGRDLCCWISTFIITQSLNSLDDHYSPLFVLSRIWFFVWHYLLCSSVLSLLGNAPLNHHQNSLSPFHWVLSCPENTTEVAGPPGASSCLLSPPSKCRLTQLPWQQESWREVSFFFRKHKTS